MNFKRHWQNSALRIRRDILKLISGRIPLEIVGEMPLFNLVLRSLASFLCEAWKAFFAKL